MANRWKGNIIAAAATTSSGTNYTGKANGAWGLNSQLQQKQGGLWAKGVYPPPAPTSVAGVPGNAQATVSFTAPSDTGGGVISAYTATSTPGSITGSASTSPITVTGLTNGTAYTFTVKATTQFGTSPESASSNSVTPIAVSSAVTLGNLDVPVLGTYGWSNGFGSRYTTPSGLETSGLLGVDVNSLGNLIFGAGYEGIVAYPFSSSGYGTKYANPAAAIPGTPQSIKIAPNGTFVTIAYTASTPYITAYAWNNGFGSKYANPSTLPTGDGYGTDISFNSSIVAVAHTASPGISVYAWSSGFGSKYANPSTTYSSGRTVKISNNTNAILLGLSSPPYFNSYSFSEGGSGFGSNLTNPTTLPTGGVFGIAFSADSSTVALAHNGSPYVSVYPWNGAGYGAKYADPSVIPAGIGWSIGFSADSSSIFIGGNTTPFINAYAWSNGFGTKYSNPSPLPAESVKSLKAFNFTSN